MTTAAMARPRPVGDLLREWRRRRRLSQLDLSLQSDISTRHLSFLETGRSRPSSAMILRLSDELDVPLRERNRLLLAGGFAPVYPEHGLDAPEMRAARTAVRQVLVAHDPNPALAVDRCWNLLDANASVAVLTAGVAPELLEGRVNALRLTLHPDGMAPDILNLGEWRRHVLPRLRRQAELRGDAELLELHEELRAYPCDDPEPDVEVPGAGEVYVPFRLRRDGRELSFLAIIATFGTALDITLAELAIETFFPADEPTARYLRERGA